jgi:threonylcarbamoyladenosine tRNA methylthiotransferase MtaB
MVGFPGETDEDFAETRRLIQDSPLTYLHVFPFSIRPGTPAADMAQQIPAHVMRFRGRILRDLIALKNEDFRQGMVGKEIDVLTLEDGTGMSSNFMKVLLPSGSSINEWIRARVTGLDNTGLQAFPVN